MGIAQVLLVIVGVLLVVMALLIGPRWVKARKRAASQQAFKDKLAREEQLPSTMPENLQELLDQSKRTTLDLNIGEIGRQCDVGRSKFGGAPDLPPGFVWDYYEDYDFNKVLANRPLAFLLQVNCEEIAGFYEGGLLPNRGMLSFFYELDTMLWGPDQINKGYVRVHYFDCPAKELVRTPPPADYNTDYIIPETGIIFSKGTSLPDFMAFAQEHGLDKRPANWKVYEQALRDMGASTEGERVTAVNAQMMGYPSSIQNDVFDEFAMAWTKAGKEANGEAAVISTEEDWQLLLQLDSELFDKLGRSNIMFGDSGLIYFGIRTEDLKAREFKKTWFTLQCF